MSWIEIPQEFRAIKPEMLPTIYKMCKVISLKPLKTKGVRPCAKKLGIDFKTLYKFLKAYPELPKRPSKLEPKYVEEFVDSEGVRLFKQKYQDAQGKWKKKGHETAYTNMKTAWENFRKLEGKGRDPFSWTKEDFMKIWNMPEFFASATGMISPNYAVGFRYVMKAIGHTEYIELEEFGTKPLKAGQKGKNKAWFLEEPHLIAMINAIDRPDVLVETWIGFVSGGRASSITEIRPQDILYEDHQISMYEPKRKQYVIRDFDIGTLHLLRQYIADLNFKPSQYLFSGSSPLARYTYLLKWCRIFGKIAKIPKKVSTHILKHTFVTQASRHGVGLETVSDQTGTDPTTLKDWYKAEDVAKKRHQLFGEPYTFEPFGDFLKRMLKDYVLPRYEQIRGKAKAVDGIKQV